MEATEVKDENEEEVAGKNLGEKPKFDGVYSLHDYYFYKLNKTKFIAERDLHLDKTYWIQIENILRMLKRPISLEKNVFSKRRYHKKTLRF